MIESCAPFEEIFVENQFSDYYRPWARPNIDTYRMSVSSEDNEWPFISYTIVPADDMGVVGRTQKAQTSTSSVKCLEQDK